MAPASFVSSESLDGKVYLLYFWNLCMKKNMSRSTRLVPTRICSCVLCRPMLQCCGRCGVDDCGRENFPVAGSGWFVGLTLNNAGEMLLMVLGGFTQRVWGF